MHQISVFGSFRRVSQQISQFVGEEFKLLQSELREKVTRYSRAGMLTGVGAIICYACLIIALIGLGLLLSLLCRNLGFDQALSRGIGLCGVGVVFAIVGGVVVFKGVRSMSEQPFSPHRTLGIIRRLRGKNPAKTQEQPKRPARSAKDLYADVMATEQRLGDSLQKLSCKVSPARYVRRASSVVCARPWRWNVAALVAGFAGSVLFVRRLKR